MKLKPLADQTVVITGASSGIGLATAMEAAKRGAAVVLAARSREVIEEVARKLNASGGRALAVCADVTVRSELDAIAAQAIERFGHLDTWVNNAGVAIYGKLEDVDEADSRRLFDVNFWGVVNGSLTALPHLRRFGGALINLGSEASEAVIPLQGMYCASKHAVKGFTDALRVELETEPSQTVSVTLIQPTAVDTPYPQHARNYLPSEPKLPDPQIDAQQVAEAILDAATTPRRDVKVGFNSKRNTFVANNAGPLADKLSTGYVSKQEYDEPPRDPQGTLHKPGQSGRISGTGGREQTR